MSTNIQTVALTTNDIYEAIADLLMKRGYGKRGATVSIDLKAHHVLGVDKFEAFCHIQDGSEVKKQ